MTKPGGGGLLDRQERREICPRVRRRGLVCLSPQRAPITLMSTTVRYMREWSARERRLCRELMRVLGLDGGRMVYRCCCWQCWQFVPFFAWLARASGPVDGWEKGHILPSEAASGGHIQEGGPSCSPVRIRGGPAVVSHGGRRRVVIGIAIFVCKRRWSAT
jgi:hypothetical protein